MLSITADALPRFMQCSGNVQMPPSYPVEAISNAIREEGTAAHYMASAVYAADTQFGDTSELVDRRAPNGVYMTLEMSEHIDAYLAHILARQPYDWTEMECDTSWATVKGRADHIGFAAGILYVDDLKFGYRLAEPEGNWTLISHAIGWCETRRYVPGEVVFTIHQPRGFHRDGPVREWRISYDTLMAYRDAIAGALASNERVLKTGPSCHRCHALATCPAAAQAAWGAVEASGTVWADELQNDALSVTLDTLKAASKALSDKVEALEELATYRLKNGAIIENYALDISLGNTQWLEGVSPEMLETMIGVPCVKKAPTPAQAKKAGMSEEVVKSLTFRPSRGTKLVRESADKRAKRLLK